MDAVYTAPGYLFRRMQQIAVAIFMEECKDFDLTPVQYAALIAIHTHPGIDATRLSAVIAFDRSTLGNARRFGVDVAAFPRLLRAEAACKAVRAFADAAPDKQPDAE